MDILKKIKLILHSRKDSSVDGKNITPWEKNFLKKSVKKNDGKWLCPNCEADFLCSGPEGGMSQNVRCPICGQGYNVSPFGVENIGINEDWINPERVRALKLNKIKDNI